MQDNNNNVTLSTGKRTASLALGIVGLVIGIVGMWFPAIPVIALAMGIIGVVLAVSSGKQGVPASGGLVLGILTIIFSAIGVLCWVACASAVGALA